MSTNRERAARRRKHGGAMASQSQLLAGAWRLRTSFCALLLMLGTLALYSPVRTHDFINYDDDVYIYKNAHVTAGLSWDTVRWSLTSNDQANWHPITWLSHALDCQLFGLDAGDHHLVSALIHAVNALLLFLLLQRATQALGPSFAAAALFAWHPINVQSVAWAAERKNVLSTLFVLLAIGAYGWYARKPRVAPLAVVVALFALALASKPMAVTLPFLLLLVDYWPLQRIAGWSEPSSRFAVPQQPIKRILLEKLPLLILSVPSCLLTVWAQKAGNALRSLQTFPLGVRLSNAVYSYAAYIGKLLWPFRFELFYPHPGASLGWWKPALALILLGGISFVVWKQRSIRPYLLVGWIWFLGSLVPVIGIVQVGDQAMADRYAYLPGIGLFVIISFGISELLIRWKATPRMRCCVAVAVLGILPALTIRELGYWQDSLSIWSRTLQLTPNSLLAEQNIASALFDRGDSDQALVHFQNAVKLDPMDLTSRVNIGVYYGSHGRSQDAIHELETVVRLTDQPHLSADDSRHRSSAQLNLGLVYILSRDYPNALVSFRSARQSDSTMVNQNMDALEKRLASEPADDGYVQFALLLRARGENERASKALETASEENPDFEKTRELLSFLNSNPQ